MQERTQRSSWKLGVVLAAFLLALACCLGVTANKAYASEAWNSNVTVVATANDYDATATTTDYNQTINVTMTFGTSVSSVAAADAQTYLQSHTSIAGRMLDGSTANYSTYIRPIDNVVVSGNTITFTVEPVNETPSGTNFTAIYSGEFKVIADSTANSTIAGAMGGNNVETLINTGLGLTVTNSADLKTATIQVSSLPKCRAMNFLLISDGSNYMFTNGTSASGNGLTIHSHMFYQQTATNYASEIVTAANNAGAANLGYTFQVVNGNVQITKTNGSAMSSINAVVYNGNYLNDNEFAVGETTEQPIQS